MPTVVLLEGSPILDIDGSFPLYVGVFLVLFIVLDRFVFKPVMALEDAREAAIDGAAKDAKDLEKEAKAKYASFQEEMDRVRVSAGAKRDELRAEGQKLERQLTDKVRGETDGMVKAAEERMATEADAIRREMSAQAPALARQIAAKLLGREVQQ